MAGVSGPGPWPAPGRRGRVHPGQEVPSRQPAPAAVGPHDEPVGEAAVVVEADGEAGGDAPRHPGSAGLAGGGLVVRAIPDERATAPSDGGVGADLEH